MIKHELVTVAVIMAGGQGSRMELGHSKVFMKLNGEFLLEHSIRQLMVTKVDKIYILSDKDSYNGCVKISSRFQGVDIEICKDKKDNYESTFLILKDFLAANCSFDNILFTYGHAPRPTSYYDKLLNLYNTFILATEVSRSTKRNVVIRENSHCIEPPYIINVDLIQNSEAEDWKSFFNENMENNYSNYFLIAPNEFNFIEELDDYLKYIINGYPEGDM